MPHTAPTAGAAAVHVRLAPPGAQASVPHDVPPLQPGTLLGEVQIELDAQTSFAAPLGLQHVSTLGASGHGTRLGCEWRLLGGSAARTLQRWIDRTQQRRRLLGQA